MTSPLVFLANPKAGGGRVKRYLPKLEKHVQTLFPGASFFVTPTVSEMQTMVKRFISQPPSGFVLIGGDGTLHALLNELESLSLNKVLGLVPLGTGKDWARSLGIPFHPMRALSRLRDRHLTPVDCMEIQCPNHTFLGLNVVSVGVSGKVARKVSQLKRPGAWSYIYHALRMLSKEKPQELQVTVDEKIVYQGQAWMVAVANGAFFGRGMKIAPRAKVNDGWLDVVILKRCSRFSLYWAFPKVFWGTHENHPAVWMGRGKTIRVQPLEPSLCSVEADGEPMEVASLEVKILPQAIQMLGASPHQDTLQP